MSGFAKYIVIERGVQSSVRVEPNTSIVVATDPKQVSLQAVEGDTLIKLTEPVTQVIHVGERGPRGLQGPPGTGGGTGVGAIQNVLVEAGTQKQIYEVPWAAIGISHKWILDVELADGRGHTIEVLARPKATAIVWANLIFVGDDLSYELSIGYSSNGMELVVYNTENTDALVSITPIKA